MPIAQVSVGGKVTAAKTNEIIGAVNSGAATLDHEEFTSTSASVASATTSSIGTLTREAAESNATLGTISTNTLTVTDAGLYNVSVAGTIPVAPTGSFFVRMSDGTNSWQVTGTGNTGVISGSIVSGVRLAAGAVLTFTFYHTSAASRVLTLRTIITRIGTY